MASGTQLSCPVVELSRSFPSPCIVRCRGPTTPQAPERLGFGLFPVRSPLLGESLLFSLPAGTKMFQFPAFASSKSKDSRPSAGWVVPFGNPRINGHLHLPAAYRSLSRPSSPPRAKASALRPFLLSSRLLLSLIAEKQGSVVYFQLYFLSSYEDRILDIVLYLICLSNMSKIVSHIPKGRR